jgi:hypothetical protein
MGKNPDSKKSSLIRAESADAKSVLTQEKDAKVEVGIAIADRLSELRLAKAAESQAFTDEKGDGSALRERADALGELAQQAQGKKRDELLDEADKWDALAEARDKAERLDRPELPAKDEIPASTVPV